APCHCPPATRERTRRVVIQGVLRRGKLLHASRTARALGSLPGPQSMQRRLDVEPLGAARAVEYGHLFETGKPVSFRYVHNTDKAPKLGARYGQDIEPAGYYVL